MTYVEAEKYILDIPRFSGKNTGEDTRHLLEEMGCLNEEIKTIHVAGTNGKGSVCAYLRSVLQEAGFICGSFTSPHLVTMRERITIGFDMVRQEEFLEACTAVLEGVQRLHKQGMNTYHPSFFEFIFAMAMYCFKKHKVDYLILETGLGGRLDATNIISKPCVCVITSISYDHMQYLGNTLQEIAGEKAGIIKRNVPVVFCNKNAIVSEVLSQTAVKMESRAVIVEKEDIYDIRFAKKSIDFSFHSRYYDYISLSLATKAVYQIENAALAVQTLGLLGETITEQQIRDGLWKTYWPARMEEIEPSIYMDGAHNEDGMMAFLDTVQRDECTGGRYLLFGVVADKQYDEMIRLLAQSQLFERIAVTAIDTARSVSLQKLKQLCGQYEQLQCSYFENAVEAFTYLKKMQDSEDIIYIAGSLYLAGQIKAYEQEV